jgi:hypothetical protein
VELKSDRSAKILMSKLDKKYDAAVLARNEVGYRGRAGGSIATPNTHYAWKSGAMAVRLAKALDGAGVLDLDYAFGERDVDPDDAEDVEPITPDTTSLSSLTDSEWHQLKSQWARGIDWCVRKLGKKWTASEAFGNFPLYRTKREAYDAVTTLVRWESRSRAKRNQEKTA